jgi:hypothetical protein
MYGPEETMTPRTESMARPCRAWCPEAMRDELAHALAEALFELDVLPQETDGALIGLYAIMDDLERAIRRTQSLDRARLSG